MYSFSNYILEYISYVRFDNKVNQQVVGIHIGTNCIPSIADLFPYCYEIQFIATLNEDPS